MNPEDSIISLHHTAPNAHLSSQTDDIQWNHFIDVRCCVGWTVDIEVVIMDINGLQRLSIAPLQIGISRGGLLPLYVKGNETKHQLQVLLEYFPNHSDMYCLSRDCILESYLPKLLTEELLQSAANMISDDEKEGQQPSRLLSAVEKSLQRLLNCINNDALNILLAKHLQDKTGGDMLSIATESSRHPSSLAELSQVIPNEIETFRAIASAKQFLKYIMRSFKAVRVTTCIIVILLFLFNIGWILFFWRV